MRFEDLTPKQYILISEYYEIQYYFNIDTMALYKADEIENSITKYTNTTIEYFALLWHIDEKLCGLVSMLYTFGENIIADEIKTELIEYLGVAYGNK